jgi:hypothetical protein
MILAVCRKVQDLEPIIGHCRKLGGPVRLASDSPEVHRLARATDIAAEVRFVERMESIFSVAGDVLRLREIINGWLRDTAAGTGIQPYLMEWVRWSEGGDTTQRLQDAVLLVNSYHDLLADGVTAVVMTRGHASAFEDALLIATAEARGLPVRIVREDPGVGLRYRVERRIGSRYRTVFLPLAVVTWFRLVKLAVASCMARNDKTRLVAGPTVSFLIGQNAPKHVANARGVMAQLARGSDARPRGLCFEASGAHAVLHEAGLGSLRLEGLVRWPTLLRVLKQRRALLDKAACAHGGFVSLPELNHRDVNLGPALWPYVQLFLSRDLAIRLVCQEALRSYFQREQPLALRTWGENIVEFGLIAYEILHDPTMYPYARRPLIFDYPVGLMAPNPYLDCTRIPDRIFVSGELDRVMYADHGAPAANIVVAGFGRAGELAEFRNATTRDKSRRQLGLASPPAYSIFYVPSGVLRGYMSAQEHVRMASSLIALARGRSDCELLIKPHPSESMASWDMLLQELGGPGKAVRLIDKEVSALHCVNAADLVVTKFSTVALEAMELDRPVISVALDAETRFQGIFEESVVKMSDCESLTAFVTELFDAPDRFAAWVQERRVIQRQFLPKKMHRPEVSVEAEIVARLMESLQRESHP